MADIFENVHLSLYCDNTKTLLGPIVINICSVDNITNITPSQPRNPRHQHAIDVGVAECCSTVYGVPLFLSK